MTPFQRIAALIYASRCADVPKPAIPLPALTREQIEAMDEMADWSSKK